MNIRRQHACSRLLQIDTAAHVQEVVGAQNIPQLLCWIFVDLVACHLSEPNHIVIAVVSQKPLGFCVNLLLAVKALQKQKACAHAGLKMASA